MLHGQASVVEVAATFPHSCIVCRDSRGPFVDTIASVNGNKRIYLCQSCVMDAARLTGLVEGEKAFELTAAVQQLAAAQKELARTAGKLTKARERIGEQERATADLLLELDRAHARVSQLETRLSTDAQAALELVSG